MDVILGGWVVREVHERADGVTGERFSIYEAWRKVRHHTWVTDRGHAMA